MTYHLASTIVNKRVHSSGKSHFFYCSLLFSVGEVSQEAVTGTAPFQHKFKVHSSLYPIFLGLSHTHKLICLVGGFNVKVVLMKIIVFPPIIPSLINKRMYEICNFSLFS